MRALLKDLVEPTLKRHRGRVVKLMGDGLLAEFASVVDAVAAAVEIQEATPERSALLSKDRRIALRIGVNIGDVVVEDGDIFGDGVNIAARLQEVADPNGVAISDGVHRELRGKLDLPFADVGEKDLKNIAQPVRIWLWSATNTFDDASPPESVTSVLERPAVAVLPFDNMSGEADQAYFADGLTEDIITELSKCGWFPVIARNSTFVFKGTSVDIKEVGKKLGARYVVEGSVRKVGNRVRITAQLIDTATGHHIWAERYDRELEDVFSVQDEITMNVAGAIMPELSVAQQKLALRKPPENMEAWDIFLHGQWLYSRFTREDFTEARKLLLEAVRLDPEMSMAHALISDIALWSLNMNWHDSPPAAFIEAHEHVTQALALDAGNAHAHACMAWCKFYTGQHAEAQEEGETAIKLNPSYAVGHLYLGNLYLYLGQLEAAIEEHGIVRKLSPRDPLTFVVDTFQGLASYLLGDYEEAVNLACKAIRKTPAFLYPHFHLAAAYGQLGRIDEAREALIAGSRLQPDLSEEFIKTVWPLANPAYLEAFLDGIRKAGLPEG